MQTSEWDGPLAEAVHGGPAMRVGQLRKWLRAHALRLPLQVVAVQGLAEQAKIELPSWLVLSLHPGMFYCFGSATANTQAIDNLIQAQQSSAALRGEAYHCEAAQDIPQTIRNTIKSLRRIELDHLDVDVSSQQEHRLRKQAQHGMRTGQGPWQDSLAAWLDLLFARHHQKAINHIRRRIYEFCCQCTRPYKIFVSGLNYSVNHLMTECSQTFNLSQLREASERGLHRIAACLQVEVAHEQNYETFSLMVASAWDYLREHFSEDLHISDIAEALDVSEGHLSRSYKAETGKTILQSILDLRLAKACDLLQSSHLGILEISLSCGFQSVEHFHRTFKRQFGKTPRAYRLQ